MVSHTALLNVEVESVGLANVEFIGIHIAVSHTRNAQVAISSVTTMTHVQLPAGYVCNKARRINEMVIGTRLR